MQGTPIYSGEKSFSKLVLWKNLLQNKNNRLFLENSQLFLCWS